jgi:hypothetical protein
MRKEFALNRPTWGDWSLFTRISLLILTGWAAVVALDLALGGPLWIAYAVLPLSLAFSALLWREYRTKGIPLCPNSPVPKSSGFWRTRLGGRLLGTGIGLVVLAIYLYLESR